jgi:ATP-dependent helicase/nuclease subunit A
MEKGTLVHSVFEMIDFKKPNFNTLYGDYVKKFLDNDLFKNIKNALVFKEYEFIYEEDNNDYHGIIDLMIVYDDYIDIVDYKLSNIDDPSYKKQLLGYKKYIEEKSKKPVNTYLYSIEKNELRKV